MFHITHALRLLVARSRILAVAAGAATMALASFASPAGALSVVKADAPFVATVSYAGGSLPGGLAPITDPTCWSGTPTLTGTAAPVALAVGPSGQTAPFVGAVSLTATLPAGSCSNVPQEDTAISGQLTGVDMLTGTLSCSFGGFAVRVGAIFISQSSAPSCTIDGQTTAPFTITIVAVWVPENSTTFGVNDSVATATLAGALDITGSG
jgi:hypothetical protein